MTRLANQYLLCILSMLNQYLGISLCPQEKLIVLTQGGTIQNTVLMIERSTVLQDRTQYCSLGQNTVLFSRKEHSTVLQDRTQYCSLGQNTVRFSGLNTELFSRIKHSTVLRIEHSTNLQDRTKQCSYCKRQNCYQRRG